MKGLNQEFLTVTASLGWHKHPRFKHIVGEGIKFFPSKTETIQVKGIFFINLKVRMESTSALLYLALRGRFCHTFQDLPFTETQSLFLDVI